MAILADSLSQKPNNARLTKRKKTAGLPTESCHCTVYPCPDATYTTNIVEEKRKPLELGALMVKS